MNAEWVCVDLRSKTHPHPNPPLEGEGADAAANLGNPPFEGELMLPRVLKTLPFEELKVVVQNRGF
jgi:hypothetical protein